MMRATAKHAFIIAFFAAAPVLADPGANEYVGEAYLMVGNLAKAKEHLAALDRLCFFGCEEYSLLKKAVAEFEAKKK